MTRYTINLSRARSKGRNKRAKKASAILREELERHEGEEVSVSNEVNQEIWKNGASKPPRKISVEVVQSDDGLWAVLSDKVQETLKTGSEEAETDKDLSEAEYEEALDGTVSEAKESVENLEDPDYDKLIQLEEEGEGRKTLLEFLESNK